MRECEPLVEVFKIFFAAYLSVGCLGAVAIGAAQFDGLSFEVFQVRADCRGLWGGM